MKSKRKNLGGSDYALWVNGKRIGGVWRQPNFWGSVDWIVEWQLLCPLVVDEALARIVAFSGGRVMFAGR